jgi:signal transduction histidine kinase
MGGAPRRAPAGMPSGNTGKRARVERVFENGGAAGALMRVLNWPSAGLTAPEEWPEPLVTTLGIVLGSHQPMLLWWGPGYLQFYNDACIPVLGERHPLSLVQRGDSCWMDGWPALAAVIDEVKAARRPMFLAGQFFPVNHHGSPGEKHFHCSYSAVEDEEEAAGVLCVLTEAEKPRAEGERLLDGHATEGFAVMQEQELQRAKADLRQFTYAASHDLREPLRQISLYCQMLKRRYSGKLDSEAEDYIQYAVEGAQRMEMLVRDLLAYAQAASTLDDQREPVDCGEVVEAVVSNLRLAIHESGAEVKTGELPVVVGHRLQMVQVFQNLISNAIKYRSTRPLRIDINAEARDKFWVFSVRDNGVGIAAQYLTYIFGLFRRLHGGEEWPGTGLGLAIVQKIVERNGGRVWVESAPDEGSTFWFSVPILH